MELKQLRYGHLMIMADQDVDGAHIKGLVINFIHAFWPKLIEQNYLMFQFITPLLKAFYKGEVKAFFSLPEYKKWIEQESNPEKWKSKYYKGLGTSTSKEAKEYFQNLQTHVIQFIRETQEDDEAIKMAFLKEKVNQRKIWISQGNSSQSLEYGEGLQKLSYKEFIYKDLVHYGLDNLIRCIPSMCDGLKQSQRKILFGCFKRKLHSELKVAQLAGYISQISEYHHGEEALKETIIKMAQNFVGANNVNLLLPIGQFGTRHLGGTDHASGRYIFTALSKVARALFHPADDQLLSYRKEDGKTVEPQFYIPILPLVLMNGAHGIALGWSTSVTKFNPREIAHAFLERLRDKPFEELMPWFKGWNGKIWKHFSKAQLNQELARAAYEQFKEELSLPSVQTQQSVQDATRKYDLCGELEMASGKEGIIRITELPIGVWTSEYKKFLKSNIQQSSDKENVDQNRPNNHLHIEMIKEYHTSENVEFVVRVTEECSVELKKKTRKELKKLFKLNSKLTISNMTLFGADGHIKEYQSPEHLCEQFYKLRFYFYRKRFENQLKKLKLERLIRENKFRFVELINEDKIVLRKKTTQECIAQLRQNKLQSMSQIHALFKIKPGEESSYAMDGYGYLLNMRIGQLTEELSEQLKQNLDEIKSQIEELLNQKPEDLWKRDIEYFLQVLDECEEESLKKRRVKK